MTPTEELALAEQEIEVLTVALISIINQPQLPSANIAKQALTAVYGEGEIDYILAGDGRVRKIKRLAPRPNRCPVRLAARICALRVLTQFGDC